jgi:phosphoribosylamine--glycine ligase
MDRPAGQLTERGPARDKDFMKVLVLGSGGREHALVKALKAAPSVSEVHAAPGSDGMKAMAVVHGVALSQKEELARLHESFAFDLVVIGPDQALADGLSDFFRDLGVPVFGPSREGARLEWSKSFAKDFMRSAGLPAARDKIVTSVEEVKEAMAEFPSPWVLKADGLALGKGVYICASPQELSLAAEEIFVQKKFGESGRAAVLEEFKPGWELSVHVLTDGKDYQIFPYAQDHKRLLDENKGPNTGGMGTVAPVPVDPELHRKIEKLVVAPAVAEIGRRGIFYRGVLFIGLMIHKGEPVVLEFNARFGDPEAQVFLPLLDGDWGEVFLSVAEGRCPRLKWKNLAATCVVMAAPGYPEAPRKGVAIRGDLSGDSQRYFLHAGTRQAGQGFVTSGGRVLNAVGLGADLSMARANAYGLTDQVTWDGVVMRSDIGRQFVLK